MDRTSFAQSGQDVLADYILKSRRLIPFGDDYRGCFIDVGCCYPIRDSNTYFFYQRGWKGLCIDANPDAKADFSEERPDDIFVNAAIGLESESRPFYIFNNPQWNTFNAGRKEKKPESFKREIVLSIDPLSKLIDRNLGESPRVDLLSIDTEGFEMQVLSSLDWARHRPKLVIVEIKRSIKEISNHKAVTFMESKNYSIVSHTGHDAMFVDDRL